VEGHEIKYGAKLTVREGQSCGCSSTKGQAWPDVVFRPGFLYAWKTQQHADHDIVAHWDHGFKSPSNPRFISLTPRVFNDLEMGHQKPDHRCATPIWPVRLRSYGTYSVKVVGPWRVPHRKLRTGRPNSPLDEISYQIRTSLCRNFRRKHRVVGIFR